MRRGMGGDDGPPRNEVSARVLSSSRECLGDGADDAGGMHKGREDGGIGRGGTVPGRREQGPSP